MLGNAIFGDGHFLDIWLPVMLGSLLGMADVLSKVNALATDVTLSHVYSLLNNVQITVYIIPQQAAFCKSASRLVSNESRVTCKPSSVTRNLFLIAFPGEVGENDRGDEIR